MNSESDQKSPGLSYQQALELNAILQDTTLSTADEKLKLIRQINIPEKSVYGNVLANIGNTSSTSTSDKQKQITQLQSLLKDNMLSGQLAARIISLDKNIDNNTKSKMIQQFGSPPPVYPNIFDGSNTTENEMTLIQTKKF